MNKVTFGQAAASNLPTSCAAYILGIGTTAHYVGSTDNLQRRTQEHLTNEPNDKLRARRCDTMWYQTTRTIAEAQQLERDWYSKFRPDCNRVAP